MSLKTKDLSPRIGSEVETNAKTLLSGAHAEEIRELLEQRGVLVFHDINFTDEEMASFAETLGNIQGGSTYKGSIFKVTFDPEHNPHGETYLMGAQEWHIDRTDIDVPPLGSMLTPRVLATKGGQTDFANTYAAYEDLPEEEKRYLEGLKIEHRVEAPIRRQTPNPTEEQVKAWQAKEPKIHPLVWQHRSGRKSLVLGGTACQVLGMDEKESDALIERLMKWSEQPHYTYRHNWRMGDLVIWDNTGTMHRMVPFDKASGRRLHRVTLEGEEPILAVA
ncbi:MAG: TauD/TfdA family dioxygenase [Novosphingobium sp.]